MEQEIEKAAAQLVEKEFGVEAGGTEALRKALAARIETLMRENPTLLKSIFYRIDLNESKLGMALVSMEGPELYEELAQQVVERMRKKAEWRFK